MLAEPAGPAVDGDNHRPVVMLADFAALVVHLEVGEVRAAADNLAYRYLWLGLGRG